MASLTVRNLDKFYGANQVLHDINLDVAPGEFVVLVGPSGCGKSTLLAMIAGLETISSGDIAIGERIVNNIPPRDRDIAMVFQSYALYPTMTVRQNITFGMESRGVPKAEQKKAVQRVSELLQISELLQRKPHQLSGGQRQRVAMGRALVRDPLLFLFDEPLSNLDAKLRVDMRTEIKKLYKAVGKTTIYVTHDQIEAMTLASRIAVMRGGYLQQFAAPREVYEEPANMFVAGFMGSPSMNFLPAEVVSNNGGLTLAVKTGSETSQVAVAGDHAIGTGRSVVLGVRPEHLTLGPPDGEGLAAEVDVVEPTGAETIVILRVAGAEVTARVDPDRAPREGEAVRLSVDPEKARLFDPETEARV